MENHAPSGGVGGQEAVEKGVPVMVSPPEYWSTGLCDCFSDVKSCCLVCWCPCVAFGQMSEIIDKGTSSCCFNGSVYFALCSLGVLGSAIGLPIGLQWIYSCTYRGKLKHDLNMTPSCGEECCIHYCCEPCALCQEYRELQNRGYDVALGWDGNMEKRRQQEISTKATPPVAPSMAR